MAIPDIFASNFAFTSAQMASDVQAWMDAIRTLLTSTLAVGDRWTESPTNTLKSPVDPISGYFMTLVLTRTTALRMRFLIKDQNGNTVLDGEADITGTEVVKISGGPKHIYTWSTGNEFALATLCDPAPEAPNAPTIVVFCKCRKNGATGADFSFPTIPERWSAFGDVVGAGINSGRILGPYSTVNTAGAQLYTAGGSAVFTPAACCSLPAATNPLFEGHAYQLVWADQSVANNGRVEVPIDDGAVGIFERIQGPGVMGVGFANQAAVLLARVG